MPSRKRGLAEVEEAAPPASTPQSSSLLGRLRNAWVFCCLMQFINLFGDVFKIDKDFDIEDLEDECMKPGPRLKLAEIGLCLLKSISSQRGLTSNEFDEHTSRQYKRRLPDLPNPFGDEEQSFKFLDFDVFTQLRVLHQLSLWTLLHPERVREKMDTGDRDADWRIDVIGWDREDRSYFLLDDSRLYRRTDPPPAQAPTKPKAKPKPKPKPVPKMGPARPGVRASKRLKVSESEEPLSEPEPDPSEDDRNGDEVKPSYDAETDLGEGYRWECVAITLQEYRELQAITQKSRDPNERNLYKHLTNEVLPQIERAEENRQKKIAQRQRELMNMEKLAHAKRSSRIAGKMERDREDAEAKAVEDKRQRDLAAAREDAARQKQMEDARESRMMTREQRLKEREYKRLLHEEELANMSKANEQLEAGEAKISERRLKAEMAKKQKALEELQQEEDWVFDCAKCGVYGENIDDGTPSIACERCSVWQHCACLGVSQEEADKDDFHFICDTCVRREQEAKQREEDAKKPKLPPLKFHVPVSPVSTAPTASPAGPIQPRKRGRPRKHPLPEGQDAKPAENGEKASAPKKRKDPKSEHIPGMPPMKKFKLPKPKAPAAPAGSGAVPATPNGYETMRHTFMNGPTLSPQGQINTPYTPNGYTYPPPGLMSPPRPPPSVLSGPYATPHAPGLQPNVPAPTPNSVHVNGYGYTNGHSPVKQAPPSPAVGSSPSLNNIPSPMIAPPKKDLQAAGLSPTKQSPPGPPFGLNTKPSPPLSQTSLSATNHILPALGPMHAPLTQAPIAHLPGYPSKGRSLVEASSNFPPVKQPPTGPSSGPPSTDQALPISPLAQPAAAQSSQLQPSQQPAAGPSPSTASTSQEQSRLPPPSEVKAI